ncbi:MAG TPA: helix-turn-helix domain-containing protein, partial [Pyrinomonadaceae bacterium]
LRKLEAHDWPGNIRELLNVVQRAAVLSASSYILPSDISFLSRAQTTEPSAEDFRKSRSRAIEAFERRYVEELLEKHQGNVTRAALEAGQDRRAFGRLKKKYCIDC